MTSISRNREKYCFQLPSLLQVACFSTVADSYSPTDSGGLAAVDNATAVVITDVQ